jgi:hypothetical protein
MTRGQLIALFLIGGVAIVAYLQSYQVAQYLKGPGYKPGNMTA